jgi:uncharacterized coiled-coil protein SlyX
MSETLMLLLSIDQASGGVTLSGGEVYGFMGVLISAIGGSVALIRHLYEGRDALRVEAIVKLEARIEKLEQRDQARAASGEKTTEALELAVSVADKQQQAITQQIAKQGEALDRITVRLEEIKATATRRASRAGQP